MKKLEKIDGQGCYVKPITIQRGEPSPTNPVPIENYLRIGDTFYKEVDEVNATFRPSGASKKEIEDDKLGGNMKEDLQSINILNKPIYTITTIEVDKKGIIGFSSRCVGFYYDLNEAKKAVEENRCDLFETCYLYAVIEETYAGIYPEIKKELWFKYNLEKEKYEKCEKPEFTKGYGVYGIG